ncbi:hypothetical protein LGN21_27770 [Burkholderia cepacia]|uniref:hypothetical protein n=1 Tax=Burkholderia cepacia TaxID=292 RepID=UPI001CF1F654|nr:hypothetical protein [Burkholderia cepacia]MCA8283389.1 hypothetical protein [Burkholderia cepacia]
MKIDMTVNLIAKRSALIGVAIFALAGYCPLALSAIDCEKLNASASQEGDFIMGDRAGRVVVGHGRLQFYSAPDYSCKMQGVFILPSEQVDAYSNHDGFTRVIYLGAKKGEPTIGWVRKNRLKANGVGIAPPQPIIKPEDAE